MRKLFLLTLLAFLYAFGYAQFPINQNLGAPSTLVLNKGGFKTDSALIIPTYIDTVRANQSLGKTYPGNIIRVANLVYMRNSTATGWVLVGSGGGGGGGSFDTVFAKYPIRVDTTGVKDTLYLAQPFLDSVYNNSPGFLDGLVSTGGIQLIDTSAIVLAPIVWKRNGVVNTQNTNALFPIPRADTLNYRTDIIYISSANVISYASGIQDTANALAPAIPLGGILITYVNVYGSSRIVNPQASVYQRTAVVFIDPNTGQLATDSTRFAWNSTNGSLIIGSQVANTNPSAILQLTSNNKGFLMPTMSAALRNGISSPANGLMVYDTDSSALFYYDNTQWVELGNGGGGGSGTVTSVATGYGLSGGTITTTGTLIADTTVSGLSGKYLRIADTTDKWVTNVLTASDSSFNVSRNGSNTLITIKSVTNARRLTTQVYNNSGTTITRGSVVYINGRHSSNLPTIALAQANDEANSYKTFALVEDDIATSNSGTIIQAGFIGNLNLPTSTYTDGDLLYLSPTVAGGYTTVKPTAPDHICKLGVVTRAHPTFGSIEIKIENGWELAEMSDVQIAAVPADSAVLQFSRVDSLWHDVSPDTVLGDRAWRTNGNGSVNSNYFLGSMNNASVRFKTFGEDRMILDSIGRLQINGLVNNTSYPNALQLANKNGRNIFDISTSGVTTTLSIKANNNAVLDSMVISDTGLIQPRTNSSLYLRTNATNTLNIVANRCASCITTGSIFAANTGTSAPIFNVLGTGQVSIGAANPDATSALDITSTSRGLLIPRMTTTQRDAISSPASQLLVANTTTNTIDMYSNSNWAKIAGDYGDDVAAYRELGSTIQAAPVPGLGTISTAVTMFTGRGYWSAVYVKRPITITGAAWFQTVAGSYTAANYNGVALYSYSGGTLTLVDSSTRDNTIWTTTTGTWGSKAFAGGTRTLAPGIYYVAAIFNNSAVSTAPQIGAVYSGTSTVGYSSPLTTNSARISGWETSVTTPPATKTMSSFSGAGIYLGLCLY